MKLLYKATFLVIALFFLRCSHKVYDTTAQVSFLGKENEGTITLKSTGIGRNLLQARDNSEMNAFRIILLRGVPGSEASLPMIEDETKLTIKAKQVLNDFYLSKQFKTFLISTSDGVNIRKVKQDVLADFIVKINVNSLRRYLEQNNIIRKLGY